jgi:hypothetical protein
MNSLYRPLSKDDQEIRILRLKPGLPLDPLEAEFRYVSLREFEADEIPFWTALSYCWRAGPPQRIHCPRKLPIPRYSEPAQRSSASSTHREEYPTVGGSNLLISWSTLNEVPQKLEAWTSVF